MNDKTDNWCTRGVFWGSHGCHKGDHTDNIHECLTYTDAGEQHPCSQCRPTRGETAQVRFWWSENGSWGPWSSGWTWFTFNPKDVTR